MAHSQGLRTRQVPSQETGPCRLPCWTPRPHAGICQQPTLREWKAPPSTPLVGSFTQHLIFICSGYLVSRHLGWVEGHPLGDPGTAAFERFPQQGSRVAPVTCSELPGLSDSLLHPHSILLLPFSEPCQPKRKKALSTIHKTGGAQSW